MLFFYDFLEVAVEDESKEKSSKGKGEYYFYFATTARKLNIMGTDRGVVRVGWKNKIANVQVDEWVHAIKSLGDIELAIKAMEPETLRKKREELNDEQQAMLGRKVKSKEGA